MNMAMVCSCWRDGLKASCLLDLLNLGPLFSRLEKSIGPDGDKILNSQ